MTRCPHCRRDRSLDDHIPLHMLLIMFLVLLLVLLWGDAVRQTSAWDCGEGLQPAARPHWPPTFEPISSSDTHRVDDVPLHDTYGVPRPVLRP